MRYEILEIQSFFIKYSDIAIFYQILEIQSFFRKYRDNNSLLHIEI